PVEMRFGGRVFSGTAVNLSRGGLMLKCEQLPPVGESVSVSLRFEEGPRPLEINGTVIRVDMARREGEQPRIGVSFERFSGRGEAVLIEHLASLDDGANGGHTVHLGTPPPIPGN
ncbi:MAG: PilZ domain-containing protein, partial [Myxococcota bacterium]